MTLATPHATPRVVNPTVIVGLGPRGVAIIDQLERAAAWSTNRDGLPTGADPHVHLIRAPTLPLPALAPVFNTILDLAAQAETHRIFGQASPPIDVFVVAAPADPDLPPSALATLITELDAALTPHTQRLRLADGTSRLHLCPILLLPPMPPSPPSPAQDAAREAISTFDSLDSTQNNSPLHLGRIYLLEPGTRTFVMATETVETMTVSFLSFLLFGSLRRDVDAYQAAWQRRAGSPPFASFLIGTVSVPHHRLSRFLAHKAAILALDALNTPRPEPLPTEDHHRALIANDWLPKARNKAADHARATFAPLTPPTLAHPLPNGFFESGPNWLAHTASPALDAVSNATHAAWARALDPNAGLADAISRISLFSLDDLRAAEASLREHLDNDWLDNPDNDAHPNDILRILDDLDHNVARQHAEYATGARRTPPPPAALADLETARTELATLASNKPDALRLGVWTLLAAIVIAMLLTPAAPLIGLPIIAAPIIVAIAAAAFVALRLHGPTRAINAYLGPNGRLTRAIERLATEFSDHAECCREVAVDHAMTRLLARQQLHIADEKARIADAVTAARAARAERADALRSMLNTNVPDDALAAASIVVDDSVIATPILSSATLNQLLNDVWLRDFVGNEPVRHLKQLAHPLRNRLNQIPFSNLRGIDDAAESFIRKQKEDIGSFLEDPSRGKEAGERVIAALQTLTGLQALTGGSGMRLHLPLQTTDLSNTEHDAPRILMTARVKGALLTQTDHREHPIDPDLRSLIENARSFHDPDRISLLQMTWNIRREQIPWLGVAVTIEKPIPDNPTPLPADADTADKHPGEHAVIHGPWGKAS